MLLSIYIYIYFKFLCWLLSVETLSCSYPQTLVFKVLQLNRNSHILQSTYSCNQGWFFPPLSNAPGNMAELATVKVMKKHGHWEDLFIPPKIRSIACLNLPSFSGGLNPWGNPTENQPTRSLSHLRKRKRDSPTAMTGGWMDADNQEPILDTFLAARSSSSSILKKLNRWQWWALVGVNVVFLVVGQSAAVLLGRFYYDQGGNSKWMATIVQTAAFPLLYLPLLLLPSPSTPSAPAATLALLYFGLGVVLAGDNMLYSTGLLYLSASTYSLICASQLAFNAVFSFLINSQKFNFPILSSVIVLSLSAALIAVDDGSEGPSGVSRWKYFLGFLCTLGASAIYSLLLSLMQLSFQRIIKKETFSVVLEMQIYTSLVATCVAVVGLFASGEWKTLRGEMDGFGKGRLSYVMTLVWTAMSWQICSVGVVGLIFVVSSLFSNVVSTVALAVSPIAAVAVFHDKMDGVKIIAMLLAVYGFGCYGYQNYLDDVKLRKSQHNDNGPTDT